MMWTGEPAGRPVRLSPREGEYHMGLVRAGLSLAGVIAAVGATLAVATLWLLLTDPVTVADAVATGDVSPLVSALADVFATAMRGILSYL
jgi:hypothetical protein